MSLLSLPWPVHRSTNNRAGEIGGNIKIKGNSDYATKTELKVLSDQIHGEVGQINTKLGGTKQQLDAFQQQTQQNVTNILNRQSTAEDKIYRLQTAGFITTAQGNALYASAQLANGDTIASLITQTPSAINMISRNINIDASVTFGNFKEDNAQKLAAVNRRVGNAESTISQQNQAINEAKNGTVDLNRVRYGDRTIIDHGKIITSLIDTDNLKVREAAQIGKFYIDSNFNFLGMDGARYIYLSPKGHIKMQENQYIAEFRPGRFSLLSDTFSVNYDRIDPNDWHRYLCVKTEALPHKNHVSNMSGSHNYHRVVWDEGSGLLCWE